MGQLHRNAPIMGRCRASKPIHRFPSRRSVSPALLGGVQMRSSTFYELLDLLMKSLGYAAVVLIIEVQLVRPVAVRNVRTEIEVVEVVILIVEHLEHFIAS
jgi:hypothetical protein